MLTSALMALLSLHITFSSEDFPQSVLIPIQFEAVSSVEPELFNFCYSRGSHFSEFGNAAFLCPWAARLSYPEPLLDLTQHLPLLVHFYVTSSWICWLILILMTHLKLRQENCEFAVSSSCMLNPIPAKKKKPRIIMLGKQKQNWLWTVWVGRYVLVTNMQLPQIIT